MRRGSEAIYQEARIISRDLHLFICTRVRRSLLWAHFRCTSTRTATSTIITIPALLLIKLQHPRNRWLGPTGAQHQRIHYDTTNTMIDRATSRCRTTPQKTYDRSTNASGQGRHRAQVYLTTEISNNIIEHVTSATRLVFHCRVGRLLLYRALQILPRGVSCDSVLFHHALKELLEVFATKAFLPPTFFPFPRLTLVFSLDCVDKKKRESRAQNEKQKK